MRNASLLVLSVAAMVALLCLQHSTASASPIDYHISGVAGGDAEQNDTSTPAVVVATRPANKKKSNKNNNEQPQPQPQDHSSGSSEETAGEEGGSSSGGGGGGGGSGHESGGGGGGGHDVAPPSYQMHPHAYSYKPTGFSMHAEEAGLKKILVGFKYAAVNNEAYDRYIFRIRYHGYPEFATNKMRLRRGANESNELLLKNFLVAQYVVCVTLFASSGLPEHAPISTSDMCIDVTFGDAPAIGGHRSTTGLLSPLLLAVAAVLLAIIIVGTKIKEVWKEHVKQATKRKHEHEKQVLEAVAAVATEKDEKCRVEQELNKAVDERLYSLLHRPSLVQAQLYTVARPCQIVANESYDELASRRGSGSGSSFVEEDESYTAEIEPGRELAEFRRMQDAHSQQLSSLETLHHLLENKPWNIRI